MCGICGWFDPSGNPIEASTLTEMTGELSHRGPDNHGVYQASNVGLGHTRLSIIDLTEAGSQPMVSADGQVVVTYNGELYNFRELRETLAADGFAFRGNSDTEVVLNAYARWGVECFARFNGMFAVAFWDRRRRELILARDRFGVKPLYYAANRGQVVFASEIKALLASGRVDRKTDAHALHEFLYYGNCLGPRTLFRDVKKLEPGHYLRCHERGLTDCAYWRAEDIQPRLVPEEEARNGIVRHLDAAVRRHLISDVPVGVFLSGGIDSSCITALASRHYASKLQSFCVAFDGLEGDNELALARQVADRFGTDHHEVVVHGADVAGTIQRLIRAHDEPFSDAANIPLYLLCEQLHGSPKVILQGDGGDELFAGYRRYSLLAAQRTWRWLSALAGPLNNLTPRTAAYWRRARMIRALSEPSAARRMALLLTVETEASSPTSILADDWRHAVRAYDPFAEYERWNARLAHLDPAQRMLYVDTRILLPNQFLEKVDKATMAHGIEVRVPMLDAELADYVMSLPARLKVRPRQSKWLLRRALRGLVPDQVLDAPKRGFGVPYGQWLRGPLAGFMQQVLFDSETANCGLFDVNMLRQRVDEHLSRSRNHGFLLYKALNLALWANAYRVEVGGHTTAAVGLRDSVRDAA